MVPRALLLVLLAPSSALILPSSALRARPLLPRTPLIRAAAAAAADTPKAPLSVSVLNLSKNIVCGGFLSLPAGVAACALAPTRSTLLPAGALMALMGLLSAYCFLLIGRACAMTKASTYRGAWEAATGAPGPPVAAALAAKTGATCLSYSMILADMSAQLLGLARTPALLGTTSTLLLPLCLLDTSKTFALLRFSSALGLGATAYVVAFMALRCAQRVASVPALAAGAVAGGAPFGGLSAGCLVYVSMLATAYMAHYNAPKFLAESGGGTDAGVARFGKLVLWAFGISALSFFSIATFGFLTFGAAASGNVLTNYATTDALASWARGAIALSLLAGYPFAFDNLRESALEALKSAGVKLPVRAVSAALLAALTAAAAALTDLGFVAAFAGATLGSAIIYVMPSIMFRAAATTKLAALEKGGTWSGADPPTTTRQQVARLRVEAAAARGITVTGLVLMALGGGVTVMKKLAAA